MKKLWMMILVFATISVTAQSHGSRKHKKDRTLQLEEFSPEELAQIKTKKLTLALDLTETQQQKITALELDKVKTRRTKMEARKEKTLKAAMTEPSKEERLLIINERLDRQIAEKKSMKTLLTTEQFVKWESLQAQKQSNNSQRGRYGKKHRG